MVQGTLNSLAVVVRIDLVPGLAWHKDTPEEQQWTLVHDPTRRYEYDMI